MMCYSVGRRGTAWDGLTTGEVVPKPLSDTTHAGLCPINFGTQSLDLHHRQLRHRDRLNWCPNISTPNQNTRQVQQVQQLTQQDYVRARGAHFSISVQA